MFDMNVVGTRIKERRNALGLTQTEVYKKIGISSGNLSGIENGKTLPSSSALVALSEILECTIDYILKGDSPCLENVVSSKLENDLLNNFRSLTVYDQEEIIDIIELKMRRSKRDVPPVEKSSLSDHAETA